jgi:nitrogen-specific signal transduction histidine kinase
MDLSNHNLFTLLDAIAMPTIVFTHERESCFINKKAHELLKNSLVTVTVDSVNSLLGDLDLTDLTVPLVAQKSISGGNQNTIGFELNITKYTNESIYYICSLTINSSKQPLNLLEKKMALTQKKLGLFDVFINRIKEGVLVFNFDGKLVYTNQD